MANNDRTNTTDERATAAEQSSTSTRLSQAEQNALQFAQNETAAEPTPVDPATGQPVAEPTSQAAVPDVPETITPDADNVVRLPQGVSIDEIRLDGNNLVLVQPDGSTVTILNAALKVPTFLIGDVEIPELALAAALQANGIDVAAGPDGALTVVSATSQSGGGGFNTPNGDIGDAGPVIDLLPPTALQFGTLERRELFPSIRENDFPELSIVSLGAPPGQVNESALASGSGGGTTSTLGNILVDPGDDGLGSLVVTNASGVSVDVTNGGSIQGVYGELIVTPNGDGTYSFEYVLTTNTIDHANAGQTGADDVVTDTFDFVVTDGNGDTASDELTVTITDDGPIASNDANGASENGASVNGNVLDNDDLGADHGTVGTDGRVDGVVAGAGGGVMTGGTNLGGIAGTYGQLALNADGTYSYTPTAGLSVPSGSTDVFTYTVIDADGDTATAELTITFSGDNFHATAGNTTALVDEDDLATGNNDAAAGDDVPSAQPGVLPHDYGPDGAGSIKLVSGSETVNGVSYTYTVNADGTVLTANDGTQDVFRVTLTDAEAGTYTVELLARVEHDNANGSPGFEDNLDFTLGYEVYDADDVTGTPGTLTLTIDDDVPVISTDDLAVYRVPGITTGTYSFDVGADIATFDASFQEGALIWTNQPADYSFGLKAGTTQTYEATYEDGGSTKTYFEITINDDGTYDFNLVTPAPVITTGSGPLLAGISGSSGLSSYTIPASSFGGAFELVITGYTNGVPDTISISSTELGVGDGVLHNSNTKDEVIRLDVVQQPGYENTTLDTLTLGLASTGSLATGDEFLLTVTYTNGTTEDIQMSYDGSGTATFDIDQTKTVDYVEFDILSKNVNAKITGVTLEYTTTVDPADSLLNFELTGADSDGDEATDPFTVNVMAGTSNDDTITTGSDNDQISGGAGDDIINGGGGADLLIGGEGDDLLIGGEGQNTYDLTDTDGAIDTVVLDPSALTGMNPDEIIGFSSEDVVDLTELVTLSTTSGDDVGDFVRLNPGDGKELQVDADGTAGGDDWVTVATFDVPQTPASIKILYDDDGSDTSGTV